MRLVAYRRVSTTKQGETGLGMQAQEQAVETYAKAHGARVIATYTEVESGKRADRPELAKAITHAKRANATLIVAKLDRLARNVHFLSTLMESGLDFVACDNPHANRLTIHILAAVAEDEARRISQRTKDALAALKARGVQLGNPNDLNDQAAAKGRTMGVVAIKAKADKFAADLGPIAKELREAGRTLVEIATHLNGLGYQTSRGKLWGAVAVSRVLERSGFLNS